MFILLVVTFIKPLPHSGGFMQWQCPSVRSFLSVTLNAYLSGTGGREWPHRHTDGGSGLSRRPFGLCWLVISSPRCVQ